MPKCKICNTKCLNEICNVCLRRKKEQPKKNEPLANRQKAELDVRCPSRPDNINALLEDTKYNKLLETNMQLMFELEQSKLTIEELQKDYQKSIAELDLEFKQNIQTLKNEYDEQLKQAQERKLTKRTIKRNESKIRKLEADIKKKQSNEKFNRLSAGKSSSKRKSKK